MANKLDPLVELDFQRTNLALGRPVNVEAVLDIAADALVGPADGEKKWDAGEEARELKEELGLASGKAEAYREALCNLVNAVKALAASTQADLDRLLNAGRELGRLAEGADRLRKSIDG